MDNAFFILYFIIFIFLLKFIIWTIYVHRMNIKIQNKIGKDVLDWIVNDGKKLPPTLPKMKFELDEEGLQRLKELAEAFRIDVNFITLKFYHLSVAFKNLSKALTLIRIKEKNEL